MSIASDIYDRILRRAEEFLDILIAEGHPRRLAEWELSGFLRGLDPSSLTWIGQQLHREFADRSRRLLLTRKPDGVVCVNPPQNAAASNAGIGILALIAGNTLVVKAPRSTPLGVMFLYRELVAPALDRHGAPAGTLNIVSGPTQQLLKQWLSSPLVNDVIFFGDSEAGLDFATACVAKGKKPIVELSGNDGFVVWRDADLDAAAEALLECFFGSSQICMVPKYAIVHPVIADAFLVRFLARVRTIHPGFPEDPSVLLSPVLKAHKFFEFLSEATKRGAEQLTGGKRVDVAGQPSLTGAFIEPTVVRVDGLDLADKLRCVREETFFPLLPIVVPEPIADQLLLERIIRFLNANEYGLRNSLWATDHSVVDEFVQGVCNGGLLKVNDSHIGFVPYLATHGGTGRTGGPFGELNYVALRTTHLQGVSIGLGPTEGANARTAADLVPTQQASDIQGVRDA